MRRTIRKTYKYIFPVFASLAMLLNVASPVIAASTVTDSYNDSSLIDSANSGYYQVSGGQVSTSSNGGNEGWWKMDESSGNSAADSSGNGNAGTAGDSGLQAWYKLDSASGNAITDSSGNGNTGIYRGGLLGWWKMDEASGSTLSDSSGAGNTLSLNGTTVVSGQYGNARYFTGDSASITSGNFDLTNNFTISTWVKADADSDSNYGLIGSQNWSTSGRDWWLRRLRSGWGHKLSFQVYGGSYIQSNTTITAGTWYFVSVVVDNGTAYLYVNGNLDQTNASFGTITSGNTGIILGKRGDGNQGASAVLDDVTIYNSVRSQSQIQNEDMVNSPDLALSVVSGEYGNARSFDASLSKDYILTSVGSSVNYLLADSSYAWSAEAWFKDLGQISGSYGDIMGLGGGIGSSATFTVFTTDTGTLYTVIRGTQSSAIATGTNNGAWHHIVITWDGSTALAYYDGGSPTTLSVGSASVQSQRHVTLGATHDGSNGHFVGYVDDVRLYNYARSSSQITNDKNNVAPGPTVTTGKYSNARSFDGVHDYIQLSDGTIDDFTTGDFTVEAWVNSTMTQASGYYPRILEKEGGTTRQGYALTLIDQTGNDPYPYFQIFSGGSNARVNGNSNIADGTWHHVTGVKTSSDIKLYVDGTLQNTTPHSLGTLTNTSLPLNIGRRGWDNNYYLDGKVDDVRIYNYARTQPQISDDMNNYDYHMSATIQSSNLLSSETETVSRINTFIYNLTSKPANTTATVQFSQDGSSWYDSTGTTDQSNTLTTGTDNAIDLTGLGWSGANFYYKIAFGGDGTSTPSLADITLNYNISTTCSTTGEDYTISNDCVFTTASPVIIQNKGSAGVLGSATGASVITGKHGSALSFNGSSDYVNVPNNADINPTSGLTVEAWVKLNSTPSDTTNYNIAVKEAYCTQGYRLYSAGYGNNGRFAFLICGLSGNHGIASTSVPDTDTWYHVAGVYDGSYLRLYVNGEPAATPVSASGSITAASGYDLGIGAYQNPIAQYLDGSIDDVRIYNYGRTADEIKEDMNDSLSQTGTAPVLSMDFNDGYTGGIDNGNLTIETGNTLTVQAGQTLAWNPGKSITIENGASIAINNGGQIKQQNLYVLNGDDNLYFGNPVSSNTQPTGYVRLYQSVGPAVGSGSDGSVEFTTNTDLSTWNNPGRSCNDGGDAVSYSVSSLSSNTATLTSSPSSGCLSSGDYVLLINLQGTSSNNTNVGNYEILKVSSVASSTVTFTTNKTKYYGNGASDDTNIGTATTNQRVMVQRIPQYNDVTIDDGVTVTAAAWNGTTGGVLPMAVKGTFTTNTGAYAGATLSMSGKGYGGGSGGSGTGGTNGESIDGYVGKGGGNTQAGSSGGGAGTNSYTNSQGSRGGGGGGGYVTTGDNSNGAGGGGGGGYAGGGGGGGGGADGGRNSGNGGTGGSTDVAGGGGGCAPGDDVGTNGANAGSAASNAGSGNGACLGGGVGSGANTGYGGSSGNNDADTGGGGGGGGGIYGSSSLAKLYLGGGGGGGGGSSEGSTVGKNGSAGGGIILLLATTVSNSGTIASNGTDSISPGNSSNPAGGGGGGAGGSIALNGTSLTLGSNLVTTTGGAASNISGGQSGGGGGGGGGVGRIHANYILTLSGTTNPTGTSSQISLDFAAFLKIASTLLN